MEFARQEYFWLLLALPFVVLLWGLGVWHQHRMRARFGNLENLQSISRISWIGRDWIRGFFLVASLFLMAVGLAYPRMIVRELRPVPTPTDLVFMVDISPSMYGRDMDPSRLGRAQRIVQRFILLKQPQDRYGLIVFNWTSVVLSYLTKDPQSILLYFDYLNQQDDPEAGTNMGSVLTNGLRLVQTEDKLDPETAKGRRRVFVLLSDGDDTAKQLEKPLGDVMRTGIKVYTFGLGTSNGTYIPLAMMGGLQGQVVKYLTREGGTRLISHAEARTMREIAEKTGGRFYRGEINKQIDQALEDILFTGRPVAGFQSNPVRKDLYLYFLAGAFACLIAGIFI
jgi:Ca-activated chloride channel family protein